MTYQPDKYQQMALKTWYPLDHKLHFNPTHPAIKLAGEAGEILDQYAKHLYKLGVEYTREEFLDEPGDLWYYVRILAYLNDLTCEDVLPHFMPIQSETLLNLVRMNLFCARIAETIIATDIIIPIPLNDIYQVAECLIIRLSQLDCTIDELSQLNYKKLNSDPTNYGWKNA